MHTLTAPALVRERAAPSNGRSRSLEPAFPVRKDLCDRNQFTCVVEPRINSGLVQPVFFEQDQSVAAAVAGLWRLRYQASLANHHKPGLVQDIVAGALQ